MRGFTLLELVLVLVIAGILAVIAVPSFQGAQEELELDEVESRLIADVRILRGTAMRCGGVGVQDQPRLTFRADGWELDSSACPQGGVRERRFSDLEIDYPNDPPDFFLAFEYPYGGYSGGDKGPHNITLSSAGAETSLCIYPETGTVVRDEHCR